MLHEVSLGKALAVEGCRGDFSEIRPGIAPSQRQQVLQRTPSSEKKREKKALHGKAGIPWNPWKSPWWSSWVFPDRICGPWKAHAGAGSSWRAATHGKDPLCNRHPHCSSWTTHVWMAERNCYGLRVKIGWWELCFVFICVFFFNHPDLFLTGNKLFFTELQNDWDWKG